MFVALPVFMLMSHSSVTFQGNRIATITLPPGQLRKLLR